jgi:hypothetical protein
MSALGGKADISDATPNVCTTANELEGSVPSAASAGLVAAHC